MSPQFLKWSAIISFVLSMTVLIGGGRLAVKDLPPYPGKDTSCTNNWPADLTVGNVATAETYRLRAAQLH